MENALDGRGGVREGVRRVDIPNALQRANRLDKVSYIQLVQVVCRMKEHSLRPQVMVGRCMTRCQFVFNVGREGIKGPTALTR